MAFGLGFGAWGFGFKLKIDRAPHDFSWPSKWESRKERTLTNLSTLQEAAA